MFPIVFVGWNQFTTSSGNRCCEGGTLRYVRHDVGFRLFIVFRLVTPRGYLLYVRYCAAYWWALGPHEFTPYLELSPYLVLAIYILIYFHTLLKRGIYDQIVHAYSSQTSDLQFSLLLADGQAVGEYYLASAFEKVLLQRSGYVGLTGIGAQQLFFRGFFDKYGIKPEVFAREVGDMAKPDWLVGITPGLLTRAVANAQTCIRL